MVKKITDIKDGQEVLAKLERVFKQEDVGDFIGFDAGIREFDWWQIILILKIAERLECLEKKVNDLSN